ncbi:unnamed protein product [Macrosiphum euphorbiae]|uniref:MADF domain-containing protein n=1 Tax=Macrosiphum euphorbiae TaxID=13131 RepID=A0AAV0XVU4_9HEMI|nr:unnamed protein product [Macrosiphum euphorbiae]
MKFKNKVIFDSSDLNHKDKNIKDSIWTEIGIKLNRNIDDCKKRGKDMRDTYTRQKKKLPTGSAASDKKKNGL